MLIGVLSSELNWHDHTNLILSFLSLNNSQ
ncbi:MAG: hypothetical protein DID90_2727553793 [Candidatus Nitrotoga sp. LAW]|nr:MAG: hypothetical protein DID90_2727553793 [Candidatus Nitrotoga sp. LAW]